MVDILKLDVRTELLKHLIEHEINYKSKKKPKNYKLKDSSTSTSTSTSIRIRISSNSTTGKSGFH